MTLVQVGRLLRYCYSRKSVEHIGGSHCLVTLGINLSSNADSVCRSQ